MITITDQEFLIGLFGDDAPWAHITSFLDDPSNIPDNRRMICWSGDYANRINTIPDSNQYYTISTFYSDADGVARRRKNLFRQCHVIVADDVKEKLPEANVLQLPPPTYKLETSPGSEQWGWKLDIPCTDISMVENLLDGLVAQGLAPAGKDPGMKGVTRYVRLPDGVNTKSSRQLPDGTFPRCRLLEWSPQITVSIQQLAEPFCVDLNAPRRDARVDGAADLPDHPLLGLTDVLTVKTALSDGRFDVICPWIDEHTNQIDDGAAVFTNADGTIGFKCHHGSCENRTAKHLLDLIEETRPGFRNQLKKFQVEQAFAKVMINSAVAQIPSVPPVPVTDPSQVDFMESLSVEKSSDEVFAGARENKQSWPYPMPLPDELLPVKPFDYALLPNALRSWVQDICERIQCPPDFVAVAVMSCLATVIGRKIGIRPQDKTDWTVIPNMWAMIVGRPGVMKSPAIEASLAPLKQLTAQANEFYEIAFREYQEQQRLAQIMAEEGARAARIRIRGDRDADVSELLQGVEPEVPILRRYQVTDTTFQALGELLRQNPNGLLVHRDELVSQLKSLDREDQVEARGFYLTAWNGDSSYTFDRIGRGMNRHVEALCLSLLGGTQPGRLSEYVRHAVKGGAADDGLIQRFGLLVWPDISGTWKNVDRMPDSEAKKKVFLTFKYLDQLHPTAVNAQQDTDYNGDHEGVPYLRFDEEAGELFLNWRTDLERRVRSNEIHPALESHLSKYRKLIPGIALLIHLADRGIGPVSATAVTAALGWAGYLESHAQRVYGSVSHSEVLVAEAIIKHIRKGDLTNGFSCRDIYRKGWARLTDRGQVESALQLLVDYDWLKDTELRGNGRPTTVYLINPNEVITNEQ